MYYYIYYLVLLIFFSVACSSNTSHVFQKESISADTIRTINTEGSLLLAGTNQGVYKKDFENITGDWEHSGLQIESASVIDFVILNNQQILAVIKYDKFDPENPMLLKSNDSGNSWSTDYSTAIQEVERFSISAIEKHPENSDRLFVYRGHIIESTDRGKSWKLVFDRGQVPEFLTIDKYHPNQIWTGGYTNIFSPYLAKSADGGETWTLLNNNISTGSDGVTRDAILHPDDANRVLVAMGGLRRSGDGGQSWQALSPGKASVSILIHSANKVGTIYASGINQQGTLFFAASGDFGDTWETVEYTDGPVGIQVNDMVSVMEGGREVLYLGTNKGVYRYEFGE